jgi:peptidyl-prolyl cis-trans isomerase C
MLLIIAVLTFFATHTLAFSPGYTQHSTGMGSLAPVVAERRMASHTMVVVPSSTALAMGLFDAFSKAFANQDYGPPAEQVRATARHILVPTEEEAQVVMKMISSGEQSFEDCARQFSTCPSASKGGSLGSFGPGTMVKEFDQVIFSPETRIGDIKGPVLTQFGFHVIVVDKRTGGGDWY